MKKRIVAALLSLVIALSLLGVLGTASVFGAETIEETTYKFLTTKLGLNNAAACGIMANIMCECSFNPQAGDIDTNGLYSYGLVMWNGPRYERLKQWCKDNGYDYTTVDGQLRYLRYELQNGEAETYAAMKAVPNTFEGSVEATVLFAELFERCTKTSYGLRAYYDANRYWPVYGTGEPSSLSGIYGVSCNYPINIKKGDSYTLRGAVVSYTSYLTSVTAGVYDSTGKMLTGKSATLSPGSNYFAYEIRSLDSGVVFGLLATGTYYYRITASNASGMYTVAEHKFTVSSEPTSGVYPGFSTGSPSGGCGPDCPGLKFIDMPTADNWAHKGIDFVLERGLFEGTSPNTFEPSGAMTRAMLVTVLYRLEGSPDASGLENPFEDVKSGKWYTDPIKWAASCGVVRGMSETAFNPYGNVTREQMATILQRYTEMKGLDFYNRVDLASFPDEDQVAGWAYDGFSWAAACDVIRGTKIDGTSYLDPKGTATRAQVAVMLKRYVEKVLPETPAEPNE